MPVIERSAVSATRSSTTIVRFGVAAVLSLVLGGATSYAQGWLPDWASSFANSASGWTILTVLLVLWSRVPVRWAVVLGAVSFVLLVIGYSIVAQLRGLYYDPTMFGVIGVVAGPFVGCAAAWLRERELRGALGTALLAGIGLGEGAYGLTVVADTTHPAYWIFISALAGALLVGMVATRLRSVRWTAVSVGGAAVVAAAFYVSYTSIG